jgi:hypothetical protein
MENLDLPGILAIVFGVMTTVFGGFFAKIRPKLKKFVSLLREVMQLVDKMESALEDDKLTKQEIQAIKSEALDVRRAWKALVKKKE